MKNFNKRLAILGLEKRKEIIKIFLINAVLITLFGTILFFMMKIIFLVIGLTIIVVCNVAYISHYQTMEKALSHQREKEFVALFTYFEIYISNKVNIYNALESIAQFASPYIKERIEQLLFEIDNDKSVQPYVKFAHSFQSILIEQLMISVFQMVDQGSNSSYLRQFQLLFDKISEERHSLDISSRLKKIEMLSVCPLIGAGMITIIITIGIVSIIGGVISGI